MKKVSTILITLLVLVVLAIGWAWSGLYSVAADAPHTRPVLALLELLRERSVAARASAIEVPLLDEEALIRAGAGNYDAMCSGCHLAPDMAETELSRGLYPAPPNLAQSGIADPAAAFWTIKHGLKASGMPAWGLSMEDTDIWGMVALLQRLPKMTSQDYQAWVDASGGHSHGAGEAGRGHDSQTDPGEHPHDAGAPGTAAEGGREKGHDHYDHPHEAVEDAPLAVAQALQAALSAGDVGTVEALLDPQVLILESGGAERSRAEYAAHHMQSDMAFLKDTQYTLLRQTGDRVGDLAWVASEASITGRSGENSVALMSTETLVLKKVAEGWGIVHVHWSSRPESVAATSTPGVAEVLPKLVVHQSPYCGCCEQWVEHMKHAGFDVEVREVDNLGPIKEALGVPAGAGSCHTAEVGGYFVEGHVPAQDIKRLLAEQPAAKGLAAPGMPLGSPGMPAPDGQDQPYEVLLIGADGSATVYARHGD